jgi:hypothetical protein
LREQWFTERTIVAIVVVFWAHWPAAAAEGTNPVASNRKSIALL